MWAAASAAAAAKLVPAAVLTTAGLRFVLTGAYELSGAASWQHIAGVVGLILCALGIYTAYAMVLEAELRRPVLPLGRRRPIPTGSPACARSSDVP